MNGGDRLAIYKFRFGGVGNVPVDKGASDFYSKWHVTALLFISRDINRKRGRDNRYSPRKDPGTLAPPFSRHLFDFYYRAGSREQ